MSSTAQRIEPNLSMFVPQGPYMDLEDELQAEEICERLDKRPLKRFLENSEQDRNVQTYLKLQTKEKQSAKRLAQAQAEYRRDVTRTKMAEHFLLLLCGT